MSADKELVESLHQEIDDLKTEIQKLTFVIEDRSAGSFTRALLGWYEQDYKRKINDLRATLETEYLSEQKIQAAVKHRFLRDWSEINIKEKELAKRKASFAKEVHGKADELAAKRVDEKVAKERRSLELDQQYLQAKHQRAMETLNDERVLFHKEKKAFETDRARFDQENAKQEEGLRKRARGLEKQYEHKNTRLARRETQIQNQVEKLREKNASLRSQINLLKTGTPSVRELKRRNRLLEEEIADFQNSQIFEGDLQDFVDWLVENRPAQSSLFGTELITIGSKPFGTEWFDEQLVKLGFEVFLPSSDRNDIPYVIVGRADWEEDLKTVIESEFDEGPYILTQEAFLIAYCLNEDPFLPHNDDLLSSLSGNHSVINHLEVIGFNWRGELGEEFEDKVAEVLSQETLDYLVSHADWDFLPPGQWGMDQVVAHFEENRTVIESQMGQVVDINRLYEMGTLNPSVAIVGKKGWLGYVTFCFNFTDKVVLECPVEGNAIYILYEADWPRLARRTKAQVRKSRSFWKKVVHKGAWLERVEKHLQ